MSNISGSLGQNIATSYEKEVFVEELEPTVNETEEDGSGGREVEAGERGLMRVRSEENKVLLVNATTMPSPVA